jgi:hypothetical protein
MSTRPERSGHPHVDATHADSAGGVCGELCRFDLKALRRLEPVDPALDDGARLLRPRDDDRRGGHDRHPGG